MTFSKASEHRRLLKYNNVIVRTCNGLFSLNLDYNSHIHNINVKRCKPSDDKFMYMWHCRFGHIGVICMKKLHSDGLLESLDFQSLESDVEWRRWMHPTRVVSDF
jgi:hypothetical protein